MGDSLGPIQIPDPPVISAFPLKGDYSGGVDFQPQIVSHVFDQPGLKTEQRYLIGNGARRFRFYRDHLACQDYDALRAHWEQAQGLYASFPYTYYKPDGQETVQARYENPSLTFNQLIGLMASDPGVTLLEVPTGTLVKTSVAQVTRFPDSYLTGQLASSVQRFIPLVTISPRGTPTIAPIYLSDRRVAVDGQLYLPRLAAWQGISQTLSESSDRAQFTFGNADDVFTQYANQINLNRATIGFALYHVNTDYLIYLWTGYARPWTMTSDGKFILPASDGVFELTLNYPSRQLGRTCWKVYRGRFCPASASNGFSDCPKDYDSCVARGVQTSFGGVVALPQTVRIKNNSTGVLGFGRSMITSVSIAQDTIYQRPIQEVYTDEAMLVNCDVAIGRDESEFYSALGIVGDGPIGSYNKNLLTHTLDGQPPADALHGLGWRGVLGNDPAGVQDYFGLDQAPWTAIPPNATYAGGLAFAEIRRTDATGLQLQSVSDRAMQVSVTEGIAGWTWTAPGQRVYTPGLANSVWVLVNVYLRAKGLRVTPANAAVVPVAQMEALFDVNAAIAAASICDLQVDKLIGTGQERQFPFRGVLRDKKALKQWMQEICNGFLGYFTFVNGKLWIGVRENASVLAGNAFTQANILYQSLQATPLEPTFNWLDGEFGDEEFNWALNTVTIYDIDAASLMGTPDSPQYYQSSMTFTGVSNKSQCARVITTRLREELGGVGLTEMGNARNLAFRSTLLSMQTKCGDVISMNHSRLPTGKVKGGVAGWTLNPDFSIDFTTSCVTDSMYALDQGPKPVDVPAAPVPPELLPSATGLAWMPNHVGPAAGDPILNPWERTFDLWQEYEIDTGGNWVPTIWVAGEMTINEFTSNAQPRILDIEVASGGNLKGPMSVYAAVTQRDANGQPAVPSNLAGLWIGSGQNNQVVNLTLAPATDSALIGYDVWAGTDRRRIALQFGGSGAPPATISIPGPLHDMTEGLPEAAATAVKIQAKHVYHAGIAGLLVNQVIAPNKIKCLDFLNSSDTWVNKYAFVCSNVDGQVPLWNFKITAFDPATATLTVSPDCVNASDATKSVQAGDVLIVYSQATSADANSITNTMWDNSVNRQQFPGSAGMVPGGEKGRIVRIIRNTGAGQWRVVKDNDAFTHQITPPWDTIPDSTSLYIVEAPDWADFAQTSPIPAPASGVAVQLHMEVPNLPDRVVLVGGFLVDVNGNQTDEQFAVYRMIYVFGQPPTVDVIGPDAGPYDIVVTDQTIRSDTSLNDVTAFLPPLASYQGRTTMILNVGPHSTIINTTGSDFFQDGSTQYVLSTPGGTIRITGGGIYTT